MTSRGKGVRSLAGTAQQGLHGRQRVCRKMKTKWSAVDDRRRRQTGATVQTRRPVCAKVSIDINGLVPQLCELSRCSLSVGQRRKIVQMFQTEHCSANIHDVSVAYISRTCTSQNAASTTTRAHERLALYIYIYIYIAKAVMVDCLAMPLAVYGRTAMPTAFSHGTVNL